MSGRFFGITTISIILFASGCNQNRTGTAEQKAKDGVTISGLMKGSAGKKVVLEEMAAREFIPVDTVVCNNEDAFRVAFRPEDVAFYVLRAGGRGYITLLIEPGEKIEIRGTYGETVPYTVRGSKGSELLQQLATKHRKTLNQLGQVARKSMELTSSPRYAELKEGLDRQFDSISRDFYTYSLDFIHQHSGSLAILIALYNLYGQGLPVFRPDTDLHVYRFVDSVLMTKYNRFEAVELLHAQIEEAARAMDKGEHVKKIPIGAIAPDFVSSRPDGTKLALSDLAGNYVLISFWAGWSSLSREENPVLREAYQRYKKMNLRILQVSLDDSREEWVNAIREDSLEWHHVSDLNRWESVIADLYYLERIPANVLVDPGRRIVERDLFGERLLEKLDQIFRDNKEYGNQ